MKLFLSAILFSLVFSSGGKAQHVQTYYVPDLINYPGEVRLSPNRLTVLEFDSFVEEWFSGQGAIFAIEQSGSKLILTTGERGGNTDLVVDVGGQSVLFKLYIDIENTITRRYTVLSQRPQENLMSPLTSSAAALPPPALTQGEIQPIPELGNLTLGDGRFNEQGQYLATFEYTNTTPYRVALIPTNLQASQNGVRLNISDVTKDPLRNLVTANETQRGAIMVEGAVKGQLTLNWEVLIFTPTGGVKQMLTAMVTVN
jgi:hypothetical protein